MHRHQLYRGDPQPLQVIDHGCCGKPGKRAAQRRWHLRVLNRESAHVQFVDHHVVSWNGGWPVVVPRERTVDHLALRHCAGAVAAIERQVAPRAADGVSEQRIAPAQDTGDVARVWIEEQLVRIEPQPLVGPIGSVHTIAVERSGTRLGKVAVEHLVAALANTYALQLAAAGRVEDAKIDGLAMLGEQRKVDARAVPVGATRVRASRPDFRDWLHRSRRRDAARKPIRAPASSPAREGVFRRCCCGSTAR